MGLFFIYYKAAKSAEMDFALASWGGDDSHEINADYILNKQKVNTRFFCWTRISSF